MTPPPEIRDELRRRQDAKVADQFRKLIAEAEQLVKSRQYQDARAKLDKARSLSSNLWGNDAKAKELNEDVDFHLHIEKAQKFYDSGDFAAALTEVKAALEIRHNDKDALDLSNKVQVAVDTADVEQHRKKAASAVAEGNYRGEVGEILKAREILGSHPTPTPNGAQASRVAVDELAKTVIGKLHEQATELTDKRQYRQAEVLVARANGCRQPTRNCPNCLRGSKLSRPIQNQ